MTTGSRGEFPSTSGLHGSNRADAIVGSWIGHYRIVDLISEGAAGAVYRATSNDEYAHDIVIKLSKRGTESEVIQPRFKTELSIQNALAKHPNIVPVKDAGICLDGQIYVASEYVDGQPIGDYCDNQRLDVHARLGLFSQILSAVQFAHQYAVIHANLKPKHIIVTGCGVPRIVGFGTGKLLSSDDCTDGNGTSTISENPEYASPEQVMGEPITTASDIYALGVILYRLLSGRLPYQLKSNSKSEILQAICEQVAEKPSKAVCRRLTARLTAAVNPSCTVDPAASYQTPPELAPPAGELPQQWSANQIAAARSLSTGRLKQLLRDDLDAIVLMAIRKEPELRYRSAQHFSDDLHRYLNGMPVRAHRDSWNYRAQKFGRRHPVGVGVGLLSLLALVSAIISTTTSVMVARNDRQRATRSLDEALTTVNHVFSRVTEETLFDQPGMYPLRKSVLLSLRRFYEEFLDQHGSDHARRVQLAQARAHVAKIASLTGPGTEAAVQYREAVALWRNLVDEQSDSEYYQENLIQILNEFTDVLIPLKGGLEEAASANRLAQGILTAITTKNPTSASYRHELSVSLVNSAEIHKLRGHSQAMLDDLKQVIEIESQVVSEKTQLLVPKITLANAYSTLGQFLAGQAGDLLQSLESYSQAILIRDEIVQDRPDLVDQFHRLASDLSASSALQQRLKQHEAAFQSLHRSLGISEHICQFYPNLRNFKETLGATYNAMSDQLRMRGEKTEALNYARKGNTLFESLVAEDAKNTNYLHGLAQSHNLIGRLLSADGQPVTALRSFQRAVDVYESLPEIDPRSNYDLACNLALSIPLIGSAGQPPGSVNNQSELSKADKRRRDIYSGRALEALRDAIDGGFVDTELLESNVDLNSLRALPDFHALVKRLDEKRGTASN